MAESEGFEPPIALRLCLISSQVHSTGLCQLSVVCLSVTVRYRPFQARPARSQCYFQAPSLVYWGRYTVAMPRCLRCCPEGSSHPQSSRQQGVMHHIHSPMLRRQPRRERYGRERGRPSAQRRVKRQGVDRLHSRKHIPRHHTAGPLLDHVHRVFLPGQLQPRLMQALIIAYGSAAHSRPRKRCVERAAAKS